MTYERSNKMRSHALLAALLAAGALTLTACDKKADAPAPSMSSSTSTPPAATTTPPAVTTPAASSTESSMKQGAADAKEAVKDAGNAVAAKADDVSITAAVSAGLAKDADLSAIKINVDTKGGVVTLNGPAPTATAKARAEEIAKGVQGVTSVDNKLEVKM